MNYRRTLTVAALVFLIALGFLLVFHRAAKTVRQSDVSTTPPSQSAAERPQRLLEKRSQHDPAASAVTTRESWTLQIDEQPVDIVLALDEAVVREANGKDRIVPITPPATLASLPQRLAEIDTTAEVLPIAYLLDRPRAASGRLIITRDLRVKADEATVSKLIKQHRLKLIERPVYAPEWAILSAAGPFEALAAMVELRAEPDVNRADVLTAQQQARRAMPNDPLVNSQWHLKKTASSQAGTDVNIENAWKYGEAAGVLGTGIRIGIVDDGMETTHPDLSSNADTTNDKDWNGNDSNPSPEVGDDHGTACAGNAAARGNNNIGVAGSAPQATLVGMRLIAGAATDAQEAQAMAYLPDLIQIKSNSWGPADTGKLLEAPGPLTLSALENSCLTGRSGRGSIFVWAGGNGGHLQDNSNYDGYANSIYTIAIGAIDSRGNRSYYSEPGSNIIVCAPSDGNNSALGITTVDRSGSLGYNTATSTSGGDYTDDFGGTSSATPTAAGIIALMLEKNPNLGWRDVQEILIRSAAKFKPTDPDWVTNSAGLQFNHDFGAGLIDATAAVNLATTWLNLPAQVSVVSSQTALNLTIPESNPNGLVRSFDLSASDIRVEHVTLTLNASHTARGDLQISLISPSGMISRLAEVRSDTGDHYSNWKFSSVRNWGELSTGQWTLRIADRGTRNNVGGTLNSVQLQIFGTPAVATNPAPLVRITQPSAGEVITPNRNLTILADASDKALGGGPGNVASVEFFANGISLGVDTSAPYQWTYQPLVGNHILLARATDNEGVSANSVSINISVRNQSPTISAAVLNRSGNTYVDQALSVTSVTAVDPDSDPFTIDYQWQSSTDGFTFTDEPGATTITAPAIAGRIWRCKISASDANPAPTTFLTEQVNLLNRPITSALAGQNYNYSSGLVLRGQIKQVTRDAIIHEFSQGPSGQSSEWIEILTLRQTSLAFWDLQDSGGSMLIFQDLPIWDNIPAGTLIVIYNGATKDPMLPINDSDPSDRKMVLSSTNRSFFDDEGDDWISLGNSGDSISLNDADSTTIHQLSYGNDSSSPLNVGNVGSTRAAFFIGDDDLKANNSDDWRTTTSLTSRRMAIKTRPTVPIDFGGPWSSLPSGFSGLGLGTPYGTSLGDDTRPGSAKFDSSNDRLDIAFLETPNTLSFQLKGNAPAAATTGTFVVQESPDGTTYNTIRTITNQSAEDTFYSNLLAASTRFVRFRYQTKVTGNIQLDKVLITAGAANGIQVQVNPASFSEAAGAAAAVGSITLPSPVASNTLISLSSSQTDEATTPATVTVLAGQSTATFSVSAVDDDQSDGTQIVIISASAVGYTTGSSNIEVTDNEPTLDGVTPAAPNGPENSVWISALRSGNLSNPSLFRLGSGSNLPAGLSLNPNTGEISGIIGNLVPNGSYPILLERYNTLGEVVSLSFNLIIGGNQFASWVAGFSLPNRDGVRDDFDDDGLANAVENMLGTSPAIPNSGIQMVRHMPNKIIFRHSLSNEPATDLQRAYQWSTDLNAWHASASSQDGRQVTITTAVINDLSAPANDEIEVTAEITQGTATMLYIRMMVTQP
ncbi:MAG: hypothetical protein EAZ42_06650 [Verrucomicrobia bacterium]|nr:MAG: hypothetical protein EAZ42_06650 [Verrucomicrobiota bacterium]